MSNATPQAPAGNARHPIVLVVLTSRDLAASCAFFTQVFGWPLTKVPGDLAVCPTPAGPGIALRAGLPEGFPSAVPFIAVPDVKAALADVAANGGAEERAPWSLPLVGSLARFTDPSGTLWGLTDAKLPNAVAPVPAPFGDAPRPAAGVLCSLEMYAGDGEKAGAWFGERFGWSAAPTMPQFVMFDPGAGIGGVFQSHTPAATSMAYVYATDVVAKLAEVEAAGGARVGDPMAMPGMATFAYFREPSGTVLGMIGG